MGGPSITAIRSAAARSRPRLRAWALRRAATLRLLAGAAAAWAAALVPAGGAVHLLLSMAMCIGAGAGLLLLRRRRDRTVLAWVLSLVLLASGAGTAVFASRHMLPQSSMSYSGPVAVLSDPGVGPSGYSHAAVRGTVGPFTLISRSPLPPAGSRAHIDADIEVQASSATAFLRGDAVLLDAPAAHWRVRAATRSFLADAADAAHDGGGLVPGLVVGDTDHLAAGLEADMRTVSLTHLTAVSGSNITIVSLAVLLLVRSITPRRVPGIIAAVLVTAGYVFLVGPEPSVTRAAAMGLIGAIVMLRGTGAQGPAVLCLAVIGVLVHQPSLASSAGLQLSVAATAALVLIGPPLTDMLIRRGLPHLLAAALAVPLTAQVGVTPVLLAHGGALSAWAVPANVLAAPAVAPATLLGMCVLVLGALRAGAAELVGAMGAPLEQPSVLWQASSALAELLCAPAVWCAWWIARIARVAAELPAAVWPWPESFPGLLLAGGVLIGLAGAVLIRQRWAVRAGAIVMVLCLLLGTVTPLAVGRAPQDWRVVVCDVGQGSATIVNLAPSAVLVIDTGPQAQDVDRCLRQVGARQIHLLISHYDADHSAGSMGVVQGRAVVSVAHSAHAAGHPRAHALHEALPQAQVHVIAQGSGFAVGDVRWEVLWPLPGSTASEDQTNGESSVVLVTTPEFTMLVPGDIGEAEQAVLAATVPPVDIFIAPHHGSADLSEAFYAAAAPILGAVSVGADNRYGHPSARSLRAFGAAPVLRTDLCGTITIDRALRAGAEHGAQCRLPQTVP